MLITKKDILLRLKFNLGHKKCFIFDLDGTLIFNNEILQNNINNILKKIISLGHEIIFATGRPLRDFKTVMPDWTYHVPLVLFSGALSMYQDRIINSQHIPSNNVMELIDICHYNNLCFNIDNSYQYYHPNLPHEFYDILAKTVKQYKTNKLDDIISGITHKILILNNDKQYLFDDYIIKNQLIIKNHSYDKCFDIIPHEVNKYKAVMPFINHYNSRDIYVFGNDFNDYELLLNIENSILFGDIADLKKIAKINIPYNAYCNQNFDLVINTILDM